MDIVERRFLYFARVPSGYEDGTWTELPDGDLLFVSRLLPPKRVTPVVDSSGWPTRDVAAAQEDC